MNTQLKEIAKVWPDIQPIFSVPHNEKDYNKLVNLLDSLIDEVGNNENHPLTSLMETIGTLIETYESQHINPSSTKLWSKSVKIAVARL
jgi:HTH-type transcriptional regulator/antitoxin HigA